MPYKINDPVCVERKHSKQYGRILEIIEQSYPYMVLTQDGKVMTYEEEELFPADPLQCLMKGDKIKNQFDFELNVVGVCGDVVFYTGKNSTCQGDTWQNLKEQGYTLLNSTPQEDIVEKYAEEVSNYLCRRPWAKENFDYIKQKLNQFKEEIK